MNRYEQTGKKKKTVERRETDGRRRFNEAESGTRKEDSGQRLLQGALCMAVPRYGIFIFFLH